MKSPMVNPSHGIAHLPTTRRAGRRNQTGTSMVEVLVALIVLSVGLLGIAAMYVTTLQAKTTSSSRMKAVNLAYDIADRMRANPTGAANGKYVLAKGGATAQTNCNSTSATCTPAQIAASDLYQWVKNLTDTTTGLPGGTNTYCTISQDVAPTTTTTGVYTITINWSEPTASNLSYTLQVQI